MSVTPLPSDQALLASHVSWKRLRARLFHTVLIMVSVGAVALYLNSAAGGLFFHAEGLVTRERVAVAPPFEGKVTQVFVHPGDKVARGQKIAVVESATLSRSLSELAAQRALLISKIAALEARRRIVTETLPIAEESARRTSAFLQTLADARMRGLVVNRSLQEMTVAALNATERAATFQAEQESLAEELEANKNALLEASTAYESLKTLYNGGILSAGVSGDIGSDIAAVGQVLTPGNGAVAQIYTGENFVLAYVSDAYLSDIVEGQKVGVKMRGEVFNARVERILPINAALPADLQNPNRLRERGRLVRIQLTDPNALAIGQKVEITRCFAEDCRLGPLQAAWQRLRAFFAPIAATAGAFDP